MRNNSVILQIGLIQYEPSWETLLRQIGAAWKVISPEESLVEYYSVIIVNASLDPAMNKNIHSFVAHGGAVLYTTKAITETEQRKKSTTFIASLPPQHTEYYRYFGILDVYADCLTFSNDDIIEIEHVGSGIKVFFGVPVEIILSSTSRRKNFYTTLERMPNEVVSKRSKGSFRQLIFSLLTFLHHQQHLPFIHQWYYPNGEPTIFTFRIDSDKGTQEQIEEIYRLSESYEIPTSWFLDVKSHESWLPYFQKFKNQEIGVHCYEHVVHNSAALNHDNVANALRILRKNNFHTQGITVPTGAWNHSFANAIELLGFYYSSEFAFDYDNVPSFPYFNSAFSPVLQLPIHPICIGSMLRARMSDDEMILYFKSIIDSNYILNEPICLYHHPTHKHNEVFEEVFRYINERKIFKLTFSEYSTWWKKRISTTSLWKFDGTRLQALHQEKNNLYHRIVLPDGRETNALLNDTVVLSELEFRTIERNIQIPNTIMRSRKFDFRHLIQNVLDWWITTTE